MKYVDTEYILIPSITIAVTFIAGYFSQNSYYWFLPLIGGAITVLGEIFSWKSFINIGMSTAVLSFFFLNYALAFTLTNLSFLLIILTSMMIVWSFGRNYLITSKIKKDIKKEDKEGYLKEYQIQSSTDILSGFLVSLLITFTGSLIALYSYTDVFMVSSIAILLAVIFSGVVFAVIYILAIVLPKYLKDKDINEE